MKYPSILMALAALLAPASPIFAAPGAMSVATFLAKAEALKAKGMMALFASDVGLLKSEVANAAAAYRRQLRQEAITGKPSACPPEHAALNSDDLMAQMRTYPAADRPRIPVTQAVADLIRKRYPCH
ncbi:hypothetical protein [Novosphingobium sp. NDB2Meth1]|uniref:hypothetical protein n=1 Tax=Novosphingobium sp. NDB2Meth1 TaxID=1892847 RepID=UPI000AB86D46|nr:hypothetical protein [Novosphingobium sp. NDB2Meth1]